jgi:hypothetical protein
MHWRKKAAEKAAGRNLIGEGAIIDLQPDRVHAPRQIDIYRQCKTQPRESPCRIASQLIR